MFNLNKKNLTQCDFYERHLLTCRRCAGGGWCCEAVFFCSWSARLLLTGGDAMGEDGVVTLPDAFEFDAPSNRSFYI